MNNKDKTGPSNPYLEPSFSIRNRIARQVWNIVWVLLFRTSPRSLHSWRRILLRLFGAKLGKQVHIYPSVKVWAPWNLNIGDYSGIGDSTNVYNMDVIHIGRFVVISQGSFICCGSHDYNSADFKLVTKPINIGSYSWICSDVFIHPGVEIPEGVVIGARSVVTASKKLTTWSLYSGNPVRLIGNRDNAIKLKYNILE